MFRSLIIWILDNVLSRVFKKIGRFNIIFTIRLEDSEPCARVMCSSERIHVASSTQITDACELLKITILIALFVYNKLHSI